MDINNLVSNIIALFKRIGLILLVFTLTRILFLITNWSYFQPLNFSETFNSFFYGIRFDFNVVFYLNSLFIAYHLLPFEFVGKYRSQKVLKISMIIMNAMLILFNLIDMAYFRYIGKRSGWELIQMLYTSTDTLMIVPQYFLRFWYLVLYWIFSIIILIWFYSRWKKYDLVKSNDKLRYKFLQIILSIVLLLSGFVFARGLNVKPLRIISANMYVAPKYVPLLLNTPFTILNTISQGKETVNDFFPVEELEEIYSPVHKVQSGRSFKPMNVVIIILESFGKEYFEAKSEDGKRFTPFLDSLSRSGLYCSSAFANAKRSLDAMPPILGGFPSLLQNAFVSSMYSVNSIHGIASILKDQNYHTAFFHGGKNGTMGFDLFCKSVGFDSYYGKSEYNNEKDFDGAWGIWDEEFFQYMARVVNGFKQPFLSVIFSLSSHEPYHIPERYKVQFFPGEPKILRTVAYTDFALRRFFETASKMKWYKNTLFVITPDHTSVPFERKYKTTVGKVSIPIIYFCPSDTGLHGIYTKVTQQLDIMPSVLDYLHYPKEYTAFGKSIFSDGYRYSVSFNDINFLYIDSTNCLLFDGNKTIRHNNYKADPLLSYNLANKRDTILPDIERNMKAFLQDYFYRLNNNLLSDTLEIKTGNTLVK
jgi:phosphoglycerol transferase MdoB-like AlkP superfamily enzyme